MKTIIPKQAKVKRLLLLQHNTQVPEEEDRKSWKKWIQATLSKHNQKLGMIIIRDVRWNILTFNFWLSDYHMQEFYFFISLLHI